MKIAVIGAGIFGCTIAIRLSNNGHDVDLYERNDDICKEASFVNQYRVHRGYHYPRSQETIENCIKGELEFKNEYGECILERTTNNYYAISKYDSFLTSEQCCEAWENNKLKFDEVNLEYVNYEQIDKVYRVEEELFDGELLRKTLHERLKNSNVTVYLNTESTKELLYGYNKIIVCTYSNNNSFLKEENKKLYQFELCEKILVKMPDKFQNESVVVMDGPFMCFDPYSSSSYHLFGNVKHAIHKTSTATEIIVPEKYKRFMNSGFYFMKNTNYEKFYNDLNKFFLNVEDTKYVGSMFTIRTVLPKREHDDARPSLVEKIDNRQINVFSGKIPTCISVANKVFEMIEGVNNG